MKKTNTKRALLMSALSLLLCVSMLVGTTFAWFTDSVTSGKNIIQSGDLDVELYYSILQDDGNWTTYATVDGNTNIFASTLWEPGYTQVAKFKIANVGSLALKYILSVDVIKETPGTNMAGDEFNLSDHLMYGIVDSAASWTSREAAVADATLSFANFDGFSVDNGELSKNASVELAMVITMPTTVGNEANHNGTDKPAIEFGINLFATQKMEENDSFGPDYDEDAPIATIAKVNTNTSAADEISTGDVAIDLENAPNGEYKLVVTEKEQTQTSSTTIDNYDITLYKDGEKAAGTYAYPVTIDIGKFRTVTEVLHNGTAVSEYDYDPLTGIVSFTATSFSPFSVEHSAMKRAYFVDKADVDAKPEVPAEYVIEEVGDQYVISLEETTVYLTPENNGGKLYSAISALQNNEYNTVYLRPGTYKEGTTIYIYSSMDIIGLGDGVEVIKQSSSSSNRHLFNATGTKADYIEVSIRNMTLDATAKTTNSKDNAAVQSIRKSKVKCYDLNIIKNPTNMASIAFYVNGNNAVDGVKYPAYLYAENCTLNTTKTFGIVSTAGSYKFYHTNLTYGGTTYTNNSGSIKNIQMAADDWDW